MFSYVFKNNIFCFGHYVNATLDKWTEGLCVLKMIKGDVRRHILLSNCIYIKGKRSKWKILIFNEYLFQVHPK